jgi:hypothetical protein
MAYTTPPTFADGNFLTATQLNILSDDIEYLYGRSLMPNPGFYRGANLESVNGAPVTREGWSLMHLSNSFRYRLETVQGTMNYVKIRINGQTVLDDQPVVKRSHPYVWEDTVSIASLGLTVGTFYDIEVVLDGNTALDVIRVVYLGEEW